MARMYRNPGRKMSGPVAEALEPRWLFSGHTAHRSVPLPAVQVAALGAGTAAEYRSQSGTFAISRPGAPTASSLTVHYAITGTATNGVDYRALSGVAVIPAGRGYTTVAVTPFTDTLLEGNETVTLTLLPSTAYTVSGAAANITIIDYPINADWRAAPFRRAYRSTIYVNQNGVATLPSEPLSSFNGYGVFFDDGGPITVTATGNVSTDVAYYEQVGQPLVVNDSGGSGGSTTIQGSVTANKDMDYIAVRPHNAGTTGTYTLHVSGPPEGVPYPLDISSSSDSGSSGSDNSGTFDYDFYRFKIPRNGNYLMQADPTNKALDVSMNVYDDAGNPIGGTFTSPINNGGVGVTENFTAIGLRAGAVYWIRVDGVNDQAGGYGVSVQIAPNIPVVSVSTTRASAKAGRRGRLGQFTVTRSYASGQAMTVPYRISGTAVAGTDYAALSGVVTIPANATSATINITALDYPPTDRSVVLTLGAAAAYNLNSHDSAVVTVLT
jgi:hypothetical protein